MKTCSQITDLQPKTFIQLLVLCLYWKLWPPKLTNEKNSVFKYGTMSCTSIMTIAVHLGLITEKQMIDIRSSTKGVCYQRELLKYCGQYGGAESCLRDSFSWLMCQHRSTAERFDPCLLVTRKKLEITNLGAMQAPKFEALFVEYGLTKDVFLKAFSEIQP